MGILDFIGTIDENDDSVPILDEPVEGGHGSHGGEVGAKGEQSQGKSSKKTQKNRPASMETSVNPEFTFSMEGIPLQELRASTLYEKGARAVWDFDNVKKSIREREGARKPLTSIDEKISKRKQKLGEDEDAEEEEDSASSEEEQEDANASSSDQDQDPEDRVKDKLHFSATSDFFAQDEEVEAAEADQMDAFTDMNLSRPILKGLTDVGFVKPTRIQAMTIPVALMGKDICGGAVTGSGKTAAFLVPVLERLLYRPKATPTTRVLVLTPTRELAAQCYSVAVKLAKYTDIAFCLCVGGISTQQQEAELRKRPDVVIATPGRLIDHIRNSACFGLDGIEILIMDEADRMLEEGFQAELTEIIKDCPRNRQTLLFSATMTDNVDQLISLSLQRPVRLFIDAKNSVAHKLTQEFIRVRPSTSQEEKQAATHLGTAGGKGIMDAATFTQREAILLALCARTYRRRTIVFLPSKAECHRMKIIFGLHDISSAELHGNLSQLQRIESLEKFRDGQVDVLLATDLAARGLDITGVETVINFQMPPTYERYVHRVGRTARYERSGRAVTLVGETDRKMVKLALKNVQPGQSVKQRVIPAEVIQKYKKKILHSEEQIRQVMQDEKEEKQLRGAEMSLSKAENMLKHERDIMSRPARTWFQSEKEKQRAKQLFLQLAAPGDKEALGMHAGKGGNGNEENDSDDDDAAVNDINAEIAKEMAKPLKRSYGSGLTRKQKRRKMMEKEEAEDPAQFAKQQKSQQMAVKKAKREARENVVNGQRPQAHLQRQKQQEQQKKKKKSGKVGMRFDRELTDGSKQSILGGRKGRKMDSNNKSASKKRR